MGAITGADAIRWIETCCVIPKGPKVGERVRLLPFQREIVAGIFDSPTRRAIVSMARQNAKSTLTAYMVLLHLAGPAHQRNGLIVSSALTREQAGIVYDLAAKIVRQSPELRATVECVEHQKTLRCRELGTTYRALSADAPTQLGLAPYLSIHDELGQVVGPYSQLYETLESGMSVQANPLSVIISTQARSDSDLLSQLIDDAATGADPRVKLFLWAAEPGADLSDERAWAAANPGLGKFVNVEEIRAQAETARRMPSMEASFRNLILNQRVAAVAGFVSPSVWLENGADPSPLDGATVNGGLDLSEVSDLTALTVVATDGSVHVFPFLPEEGIAERSRRDHAEYELWAARDQLILTPGRTISYDFVAEFMKEIFAHCNVRSIAFDRYNMRHLLPCLERAGFSAADMAKFVGHGQGFIGMGPSIRELERRLLEKKLRHGNHPVLLACAANAVVEVDAAGNRKFTKRKSTGRIDALQALAMAVGAAADAQPREPDYRMMIL